MKIKLSELQARLLNILAWYHDFCVNNNLTYYILGGTMLGAARHKGFIPWDDDIDVGMPRRDYDLFLELSRNKMYGDYIVEGIKTNNNDFFYGYTKVYDTSTTLIENTRYKTKRGLYIDVFPLDGVCDDSKEIMRVFLPINLRYNILLSKTCGLSNNRKWYKNLVIIIMRIIPGINNKKLMYEIDNMCKKNKFGSKAYVGNLYGNWGKKEIVKREIMGVPKMYKFENLFVYGPEKYNMYLTSLYGNWKEMPPKEKRVSHHDYLFCDLNKSYK